MKVKKIEVYDTTLRDGMQTEGVSFSLADKLAVAKCLDDLGVQYIEGGYAGSNQKEMDFFGQAAKEKFKNSKITAFGCTRRANAKVGDDMFIKALVATKSKAVTLVGKTWDLHVKDVLKCSLNENLNICADSVKYLKSKSREVIFDAEHFFDGYKNNLKYAMKVLHSAADAGADILVLCDTNGGSMPGEVYDIVKDVCSEFSGLKVEHVMSRAPLTVWARDAAMLIYLL
jgi:2-isopropylmalate synthase